MPPEQSPNLVEISPLPVQLLFRMNGEPVPKQVAALKDVRVAALEGVRVAALEDVRVTALGGARVTASEGVRGPAVMKRGS